MVDFKFSQGKTKEWGFAVAGSPYRVVPTVFLFLRRGLGSWTPAQKMDFSVLPRERMHWCWCCCGAFVGWELPWGAPLYGVCCSADTQEVGVFASERGNTATAVIKDIWNCTVCFLSCRYMLLLYTSCFYLILLKCLCWWIIRTRIGMLSF